MSLFRNAASALHRALKLLALASGPAGAVFGFLAWQEARSSGADLAAGAVYTGKLVHLFSAALEQGAGRMEMLRATPESLGALRLKTEKTRERPRSERLEAPPHPDPLPARRGEGARPRHFWQTGQKNVDRPVCTMRLTVPGHPGVTQRSPSRS
jgi:hypothetical protein